DDKRNSLFAKFYARVDVPFIKGLSYTINFGNNYRWARRFNSDEGDGAGTAFKMNSSAYDWTLDNILSYKTTIADKHNIDATFVYGARENEYEETMAQGIGFSNQELTYNSLEQAETFTATSDAWEESYVYQMGRLAYNYADKYYLTATLRRDGFSAFPDGNKTALFPSAALGWVVSEENFMRDSFANYLKLRLSYGANGNLINRYASSALVTSEAAYVDGSTSLIGQEARELANPNLVWESTTGFNYGIDFGIFNNLVSGSLEYYNTTTDDLIFGFVIPEATGFSSILSNIGEVKNTGFEASLNINPLRTDNFNWNLGIVFATNQNEITALPGQDNNDNGLVDVNAGSFNDQFLEIGESIGAIYNYEQDGFWQISDFQAGLIEDFQIGSERLVDQNGDGVIDTSDLVVVGRTEPAYQFSISNQFTYKQFDLSFLLNSVQGGQDGYLGEQNVWEGGIGTLSAAVLGNFYREINFWTPNNTNPDFRSPASFQEAANFRPWEDRSFVRLQDISLSYNLDSNLTDKLGMGNCRLYVSGKNLITWTDWNGWDPETNTGIALAGRPVMRSIALGLDISF
ncbi:MAG: SusC/RagA family TonB-linked outer membrane protein, partial [Bacteroidota bacterium]